MDLVTLVLLVHRARLDLQDLLSPQTESEAMRTTPGITQPLKERKEIEDQRGRFRLQVPDQPSTFTP